MKKLSLISLLSALLSGLAGCSDFMEFPPAADFNIDSVFAKYTNAEKLVHELYSYPIPLNIDTRNFGQSGTRFGGGSFASAVTDEGQSFHVQSGYQIQQYYIGNVDASFSASWSSATKGEDDYNLKWSTIRKAYVLLENIDRVPDATVTQKERIKGEAKLMIATVYFEMFKRYGGVPIIRKAFNGAESQQEINLPRATLQETYDFIYGLIQDVITNYNTYIPANYTNLPGEFGRFPMAFAYGLKARFLLYAASPLYNTDRPYSDELGENSNLICFMNKNPERWKWAADAATEAINYCLANGYKLVDNPSNRDNGMNYSVANIEYPSKGNTEVIWGVSLPNNVTGGFSTMHLFTFVRGIPSTYGYAANLIPLNQVERFELKGDTPGQYKNWNIQQSFLTGIATDETNAARAKLQLAEAARKAYEGLDPRFYASVTYNGVADYGKWGPLGDIDMADAVLDDGTDLNDLDGQQSEGKQRTTVLHFLRKFTRGYEGRESIMRPLNIYMRLAELYLIRAEALNEYNQVPVQQIYDDLKTIRERSGMCQYTQNLDQTQMRDVIAHERNIELFYEDHRWFDLRRTLEAAKKIPVTIYKVQIRKWYHTKTDKFPYKITYDKVEYQKRFWSDHWYMNPFPKSEINKFYGLVQNPGW
ncbi:RagB/SusD family nutrient uptake outer membrane protein [Bacteroides xylanisolvens]|uniref:RagB/SusD family nutrient uptake outer membrane protein n=1 Tax=Bacteroides xylanisolvens TaxID=371601 RepID=UPI0035176204